MLARFAVVLALAACGDHVEVAAPDAPGVDTGFPAPLAIGASSASITLPFTATLSGQSPSLGTIAITGDTGSVQLGTDTAPSFVYVAIPFVGYVLYQGFAVTPSRWDVFWLYCEGTTLTYVYDEPVTGSPILGANASGSCASTMTTTSAAVALPALSIAPPHPRAGFVVDGAQVSIAANGVGTFGPQHLPLIAFDVVDCSTGCGTPGWYELHSLVWDDARQAVTFVIVYLAMNKPNQVELAYARSLPDLADPIGDLITPATWSMTSAAVAHRGPGIPPPSRRAD